MSLSPLRSTLFPYTTLFRSGDMDVVIAGGVESMTRSPMFSNVGETEPSERLTKKYDIVNQGIAAEKIAEKWGRSEEHTSELQSRGHLVCRLLLEKKKKKKKKSNIQAGKTREIKKNQ